MNIQKSFEQTEGAAIYIVPTPIGNLEDITFRALTTLKNVAIIGAEDTRLTKKLLNHFDISTRLLSYHEHSEESRIEQLLQYVRDGESIAIVSDAGMPIISDPGHDLVKQAIAENLAVIPLPGANAALCALVSSGLPAEEFLFYGFLPRKKKAKTEELERLATMRATLIIYESPHRLKQTIEQMKSVFGERQVSIARELTKRYEEHIRGTFSDVQKWLDTGTVKGEFVIVCEGCQAAESHEELWWSHLSIVEHVDHYVTNENIRSKEAIKRVASERQMSRRDIYQAYHVDA